MRWLARSEGGGETFPRGEAAYTVPFGWGALYITRQALDDYGLVPLVPEAVHGNEPVQLPRSPLLVARLVGVKEITEASDRASEEDGNNYEDTKTNFAECAEAGVMPVVALSTKGYSKGGAVEVTVGFGFSRARWAHITNQRALDAMGIEEDIDSQTGFIEVDTQSRISSSDIYEGLQTVMVDYFTRELAAVGGDAFTNSLADSLRARRAKDLALNLAVWSVGSLTASRSLDIKKQRIAGKAIGIGLVALQSWGLSHLLDAKANRAMLRQAEAYINVHTLMERIADDIVGVFDRDAFNERFVDGSD